jgi:hypothetical protein
MIVGASLLTIVGASFLTLVRAIPRCRSSIRGTDDAKPLCTDSEVSLHRQTKWACTDERSEACTDTVKTKKADPVVGLFV